MDVNKGSWQRALKTLEIKEASNFIVLTTVHVKIVHVHQVQ